MYDNFKSTSKNINCSIHYYKNLYVPSLENLNYSILTPDGVTGSIYVNITDQFVALKIVEQLERNINTENIILVADDPMYEPALIQLQEKEIDITLVMYASHDGRTMFTKHMWGDIVYPLAQSLGLEPHEW